MEKKSSEKCYITQVHLHQASASMLPQLGEDILFSLETMESFQNGVATHFQVTLLFSMKTESLASWQSCCSVNYFLNNRRWTIAGVNAPSWYSATHYYANSSPLKNRRCELILIQQIETEGSTYSCTSDFGCWPRWFWRRDPTRQSGPPVPAS